MRDGGCAHAGLKVAQLCYWCTKRQGLAGLSLTADQPWVGRS